MSLTYCGNLVRQQDPDRYLLSLFAPPRQREALWALFALNCEVARTRSVVTETALGHIRLQWWRDQIARVYAGEGCGEIPALSTLAPLIHAQILPQTLFDSLIYAREFDLEDVAPPTLEGLRRYCDFTTSPLNELALKILQDPAEMAEIQHVSVNFALIKAIRSVPEMLFERRCLLPEDLLRQKNLTPAKIMDFDHKQDVTAILSDIAQGIESYRKPKSSFLKRQQAITFIHLNYLKKHRFDVFSAAARLNPPFLALRLALS